MSAVTEPLDWPRSSRASDSEPAGGGSHKGRRQGDQTASKQLSSSLLRQPTCEGEPGFNSLHRQGLVEGAPIRGVLNSGHLN